MAHLSPLTSQGSTLPPPHQGVGSDELRDYAVDNYLQLQQLVPGHVVLGSRQEFDAEGEPTVSKPCVGVVRLTERRRREGEETIHVYFETDWPMPDMIVGNLTDTVEIAAVVTFEVTIERVMFTTGSGYDKIKSLKPKIQDTIKTLMDPWCSVQVTPVKSGAAFPQPLPVNQEE